MLWAFQRRRRPPTISGFGECSDTSGRSIGDCGAFWTVPRRGPPAGMGRRDRPDTRPVAGRPRGLRRRQGASTDLTDLLPTVLAETFSEHGALHWRQDEPSMFRYRLRTLLILSIVLPPLLAWGWF